MNSIKKRNDDRTAGCRFPLVVILAVVLIGTAGYFLLWSRSGDQGPMMSPPPGGALSPTGPLAPREFAVDEGQHPVVVETRPFASASPMTFKVKFFIEGASAGAHPEGLLTLPPTAEVRVRADEAVSVAVSHHGEFWGFKTPTRPRELSFDCDGFESATVRVSDSVFPDGDLGAVVLRGAAALAVTVAGPAWPRPEDLVIEVVDQAVDSSRLTAKGSLSLSEGRGEINLRVRASERLSVRLRCADPGIGLRPHPVVETCGRPGETTRVHFDLNVLPWTEVRLSGVHDRHRARIYAQLVSVTEAQGALGATSPIGISFADDRTARGIFHAQGFVEGVLLLPDGAVPLREVRGKVRKWKAPLPRSFDVESEVPLSTVMILTSEGAAFQGSLAFSEPLPPVRITGGEPILLRTTTLHDKDTMFRTDSSEFSVAECHIVWEASDFAILRLPAPGSRTGLELRWTVPQSRVTKARLFPLDTETLPSIDVWRRPGIDAKRVTSESAMFGSVAPGRYVLWVESKLGTALLRTPALQSISVPPAMPASIMVPLEASLEATFVVRNWQQLPVASRPAAVAVERGSPGTILDPEVLPSLRTKKWGS